MARSVNKCTFIGNVGQDPEVRFLPSGVPVANLSIALNETWKDKQTGEKQERTEWVRLVAFNKLAEIIQQFVVKGSRLYVESKCQTRKWQDQNGQDKYSTEFIVNDLVMLDSRQDSPNQGQRQGGQQGNQYREAQDGSAQQGERYAPPGQGPGSADDFDDSIPF